MASDSDSTKPSFFEKVEKKLKIWMSKPKDEVGKTTIASSTKFEDLFPFENDLPEVREEKFDNLSRLWKPQSDLNGFTMSPWATIFVSSLSQVPFLRLVRSSLKVIRFNPIIAVSTTVGFAGISGYVILTNQLNQIVRGEVYCAECHLIRTGAYQFLCTALIPSINSILASLFSAMHNPGIPLPIDTLKNWASFKEALKITGQAIGNKNIMLTFLLISTLNVAQGVGFVYYAMKQYHDVHARLLKEAREGKPFI
ncbi:uncharacterized protein LOC107369342 [Tetranychus urticae]|uniref:Uncharacterized protein n=1 Tax=Tetranychus urticae TaxID=32264 RepID=T1L165_TETUR|nr:uncharacterized protein LOC107369342 [Tetranychus urticae]